jgi:hypothetical protein
MKSIVLSVLAGLAPLLAQDAIPADGPIRGNFDLTKPIDLGITVGHIHTAPVDCKDKPDGLIGKYTGVYYACIDGKEVCSKEKGKIPRQWITDFDAHMRQFDERHRTIVAEARAAKAAGRRPNLAVGAAQPVRSSSAQSANTAATAPPTQTVPAPPVASRTVANSAVAEETVRAIAIGTLRADVLAQLGEPRFRLSGGVDRWTYPLTNNGSARLEFRGGKLADVQIIPAP